MKIVVCLKAVPTEVTKVGIADTGDRVDFESPAMSLNESDEYALEEALVLRRQFGGEVIVITAGPLRAQEVLHKGLAKNADKAVRVDAHFGDAERTSAALAEAIDKVGYDLVLTGVESSEDLAAEVGVRIAERLRLPYAYAVTNIETGESPERIRVAKEIGGGTMELLEIPLPALLCIQAGIQPMSYVPVRRLHQARGKPVESLGLGELGVGERKGGGLRIVDIFPPSETGRAELIEGEPSEIGRRLLQIIEGRSS